MVKIVIAVALLVLGLAIGFIIAWVFRVGASENLLIGLLLVAAGGIVGFVVEWLIDEAYRRNRELQRQLIERQGGRVSVVGPTRLSPQSDDTASQALADTLHQREDEVHQLRDEIDAAGSQLETLRREFEAYQQTHPDNLTVIKGIGQVYQRKLRDIGINSFEQLATFDPDRLRRMLDIKDWQRVNVESWTEQARDWTRRANA